MTIREFHGIIHNFFRDKADYDELVNDLYCYLMEDNGRRLRTFGKTKVTDQPEDTIFTLIAWLKTTAQNFFDDKAEIEHSIEECRKFVKNEDGELVDVEIEDKNNQDPQVQIDANIFFDMIKLERDREVLNKYFVEDLEADVISEELGISKDNLYNIKKRALNRLQQAARHATSEESLCSIICEQYVLDVFGVHKSIDELCEISKEKGWLTETGVKLEDIGAICRELGLCLEAKSKGDLDKLKSALEMNKQIIVAVDGGELTGDPKEEYLEDTFAAKISDHCVVVLVIDDEKVTLFDPNIGTMPLEVSKDHFMDAWHDSDNYYIAINQYPPTR